jgi:signal transduction histidine kinase
MKTKEALRRNKLFESMSVRKINQLAKAVEERSFAEGEHIFRQGEKDGRLYMIAAGRVGIFNRTVGGVPVILVEIGADDYFGELEVLDGLPRSADARALTDVEIMTIPYDTFKTVLRKDTNLSWNVLQQLSFRLRKTNQMIARSFEYRGEDGRRQMDRMTRLIEASKSVNSTLNVDSVLEIILDTAIQATAADRGTLYLVDAGNNEIWSKLLLGEHVGEIRLPMGKGIAGYVAMTGETVNTDDPYALAYFNPEVDERSGYRTDTVLCMPMRNSTGKIIGIFQLLNKIGGSFNRDDEDFIEALSAHASVALENARLHTDIVHNERLTAVGRMANTIIHDLKSPMNTIKAYTKRLQMESGSAESIEIANEVIRQADRLINMVQEILDFSRGGLAVEMNTVNVEQLIMTMYRFIERDFKDRGIVIDTDLRYTGDWKMDADKMIRVLFNIAGNASDAMKNGGSLSITTAVENGELKFSIADTGVGMSPETQIRMFEPFFTHGKMYGTGLGLAIVKKIVGDHNGRIDVESLEGKGTTFSVYLPKN